MNVVYLHCHDVGKHLSCYGAKVNTPNLQKLAEHSLVYDKCFTVSPTCSPSRGCLVTSRYPSENGLVGLAHLGFRLNDYNEHISSYLAKHGIKTALFGVQHEIGFNHNLEEVAQLGYDTYSCGQKLDEMTSAEAVEYLNQAGEEPFFLAVGFYRPHRPFQVDESLYQGDEVPPQDIVVNERTKQDTAEFNHATEYMDRCAGEVIDACMKRGDTAIIFTTDHGVPYPYHKCFMYDKGTNVTFMHYMPNGRVGRVEAMVDHLDFFPTVCDMFQIEKPKYLRGTSLMCYQNGFNGEIHDEIYGEINFHFVREEVRAIRTPKYKLIKHFDWDTYPYMNTDYSWAKEEEEKRGLYEYKRQIEFFNLEDDPVEHDNLHGKVKYEDIENDLMEKLEMHMKEIHDPLLEGKMKLKKGQICRENLPIINHAKNKNEIPLEPTED